MVKSLLPGGGTCGISIETIIEGWNIDGAGFGCTPIEPIIEGNGS
jgi:hypothetical protein